MMSNWVGEIGQHVALIVVVKGYIHRPAWGTDQRIILFEDDKKNILTINTVSNLAVGKRWLLDGVVKNQKVFGNQKQTHLIKWGLMMR